MKTDRENMLTEFKKVFKNNYLKVVVTNWGNPNDQPIPPNDVYKIYKL